MTNIRIHGQSPTVRRSNGKFLRIALDGEIVGQLDGNFGDDPATRYIQIVEGGGFDDTETTHDFKVVGTRLRKLREGNPHCYAIWDVHIA